MPQAAGVTIGTEGGHGLPYAVHPTLLATAMSVHRSTWSDGRQGADPRYDRGPAPNRSRRTTSTSSPDGGTVIGYLSSSRCPQLRPTRGVEAMGLRTSECLRRSSRSGPWPVRPGSPRPRILRSCRSRTGRPVQSRSLGRYQPGAWRPSCRRPSRH